MGRVYGGRGGVRRIVRCRRGSYGDQDDRKAKGGSTADRMAKGRILIVRQKGRIIRQKVAHGKRWSTADRTAKWRFVREGGYLDRKLKGRFLRRRAGPWCLEISTAEGEVHSVSAG